MRVFKFGGASIANTALIENTAAIILKHTSDKLLVVVSAMGKTTNALEKVVDAYYEERTADALQLFEQVKQHHLNQLKFLVTKHWEAAEKSLKDFFTEVEWLLYDKPVRHYDYYYDQIVCCGELLSSTLLYYHLKESDVSVQFADVRDIIKTDDNFRDAGIDYEATNKKIAEIITPAFNSTTVVITQGFLGATDENESTTLGREGSDFTAAIFANLLNAQDVTIWKDVAAVMNADPKKFLDATSLPSLSYQEVIEMAYYGAQVIHPKTIKPLQNKKIPLFVKSFTAPNLPGTIIASKGAPLLPPIIVQKEQQVMMYFTTKDFSFAEEQAAGFLQQLFVNLKIKPNLSQHTAISLFCCFDDRPDKIEALALAADELLDVSLERNVEILTIRHYTAEAIQLYTAGKKILLMQKTEETIQMILRPNL